MCIAIYKPAGKMIDVDVLKNCYSHNTDGCGYAYVREFCGENKVIVKKFMVLKKFLRAYKSDEANHSDSPFIVHFRDTSAGVTNLDNCHPFSVNDTQAFIHNGTIYSVSKHAEKSDTNMLNEEVLKKLPLGWHNNEAIINLLTHFIGSTKSYCKNKLVFLNADKTYLIVGEQDGHWSDDIWWSNNDYKTRWTQPTTNGRWAYYLGGYPYVTEKERELDREKAALVTETLTKYSATRVLTITRNQVAFLETTYTNGIVLCRRVGDNVYTRSELQEEFYKTYLQIELVGRDQLKDYKAKKEAEKKEQQKEREKDNNITDIIIVKDEQKTETILCDACQKAMTADQGIEIEYDGLYTVCSECYDWINIECSVKRIA